VTPLADDRHSHKKGEKREKSEGRGIPRAARPAVRNENKKKNGKEETGRRKGEEEPASETQKGMVDDLPRPVHVFLPAGHVAYVERRLASKKGLCFYVRKVEEAGGRRN